MKLAWRYEYNELSLLVLWSWDNSWIIYGLNSAQVYILNWHFYMAASGNLIHSMKSTMQQKLKLMNIIHD